MDSIRFCDEASALIDVWSNLPRKAGQLIPSKESFSPVGLGKYLRSVFLYEYVSDDEVKARVAGTSMREFLGHEITGKNVYTAYPSAFLGRFKTYYNSLRDYPCAGYTERPYRGTAGVVQILKSIQLPLADADGNVRYYVGIAKSYQLPEGSSHLKAGVWDSEADMLTRYIDLGAGIPASKED